MLLQLLAAVQKPVVFYGMAGVLQGQQGGAVGDLLVFPDADVGDGAVGPCHPEHTVDVELTGAQDLAPLLHHGYPILVGGFFIGAGNGGHPIGDGFHLALQLLAVGQAKGDLLPQGQALGGNVHRHGAVQGQEHQSAGVIHGVGDSHVLLGVDLLHPAGGGGLHAGGGGIVGDLGNGGIQVLHQPLELRNGGVHRYLVHLHDGVTGTDGVPVFCVPGLQLQGLGNLQVLSLRGSQGPGPQKGGGDGLVLRLGRQDPALYAGAGCHAGGQAGDQQCCRCHQAQCRYPEGTVAAPVRDAVIGVERRHRIVRRLLFAPEEALFLFLVIHMGSLLSRHSAGPRWEAALRPCWRDTGRRSRRWRSRRPRQ